MPEQGILRRPLLLASAGLVTATIFCLAFAAYTKTSHDSEGPGLHRSNAVRRSRRRWRRGHAPRDLSHDPVNEAIRHLHGRNAARQPYGRYENRLLFDLTQELLDQGRYDLLPTNLGPMVHELTQLRTFTDFETVLLNHHVESIFIQNFLVEEFPTGYIIGEDVESLVHAFRSHGISESVVRIMIERFDAGKPPTPVDWDLREGTRPSAEAPPTTHIPDTVTARDAIAALTGHGDDGDSDSGWENEDDESDPGGSQGMLDLLYHIAGEQAKRDAYVHREVRCSSCGMAPIRGIRYHCANCYDYDLCETCEAQQVHLKSHVFYKIRIPAPLRGHNRQAAPVWYPGDPNAFPDALPENIADNLMATFKMEKTVLDSLYEQFKCIAGHHMVHQADPILLGIAINRRNFDYYFTTTSDDRAPPQNLIYDRIFAFYDTNNDDLITFDEFVRGNLNLQNRTRAARAKRIFQGYDLDGDGYVNRRDFLRMLRAYYAWHKELNKEIVIAQQELDEDIREAVHGTQPISAAFGWNEYAAHVSRGGQDKSLNMNGDLEISNGPNGVVQNDSDVRGDRARSVGNVAVRGQTRIGGFRSFRQEEGADEPVVYLPFSSLFDSHSHYRPGDATEEDMMAADPTNHIYGWPPEDEPERIDIINGIGADISTDEIMDPIDRARVIYAQSQRAEEQHENLLSDARRSALEERWKHRQFYLDEEEGMSKPPGYTEPDSSDDESLSETRQEEIDQPTTFNSTSRRQSMRSRSSSKVRFDDSAFDTDHETRSNASSRSIPINERWGGFELGEPERDIGKEILYQTIQQGFNELLDPLFKEKEEEALQAMKTKSKRQKWQAALVAHQAKMQRSAMEHAQTSGADSTTRLDVSDSNTKAQKLSWLSRMTADDAMSDDSGQVSHAANDINMQSSPTIRDPTLPHHRPNDLFTATLLADSSTDPILSPSESTLATWQAHQAIDLEANVRNGYGKLSFEEFQRKLIKESINDVQRALDIDTDEETEIWNSTADLGRLSFLGHWLELARF